MHGFRLVLEGATQYSELMQPNPPNEPNSGLERVRYSLRATAAKDLEHNPLRAGTHSRGYLPHVKREGASHFVTFRLADSLPKGVLLEFESERAERLRRLHEAERQGWETKDSEEAINRDFRRRVERYLDKGHGTCHLRRPEIGELVASSIAHFEGERYLLDEWVVMPNHVHVVVWPMPNHLLSDTLKSWKQFTSRRAKPMVGLEEEPFWEPECYDRWIRDDDEKGRICRYVRNNPVSAGLCLQPEDWPWGSASGIGRKNRPPP